MKYSRYAGLIVLALAWLGLCYMLVAAGGFTFKNCFLIVATGIIIFVPLWRKIKEK